MGCYSEVLCGAAWLGITWVGMVGVVGWRGWLLCVVGHGVWGGFVGCCAVVCGCVLEAYATLTQTLDSKQLPKLPNLGSKSAIFTAKRPPKNYQIWALNMLI